MLQPGPAGKIQTNHLIADQLVNDRISLNHHVGRYSIKPIHQLAELGWAHALRQCRRTTYVCKEEGNFDFGTARVPRGVFNSEHTEMRVFLRGALTNQAQERSPGAAKRGVAELTAFASGH